MIKDHWRELNRDVRLNKLFSYDIAWWYHDQCQAIAWTDSDFPIWPLELFHVDRNSDKSYLYEIYHNSLVDISVLLIQFVNFGQIIRFDIRTLRMMYLKVSTLYWYIYIYIYITVQYNVNRLIQVISHSSTDTSRVHVYSRVPVGTHNITTIRTHQYRWMESCSRYQNITYLPYTGPQVNHG